jgi:hypothetical protein
MPVMVTVDDYLAFNKRGQLAFSNISAMGDLWPPLMEKAWASINGNYEYIFGGEPSEPLQALLGSPADYYDMETDIGYVSPFDAGFANAVNLAWSVILEADNNFYPMTACIGSGNNYGLTNNHAYTLVGAYQIYNNNQVVARLIEIRNPWGIDVYTGKWSDLDTASWTIQN